MTAVLDSILDDLRLGLARRAERRRRARNATAAVLSSFGLAAAGLGAVGVVAETSPGTASGSTVAGRLIVNGECAALACWPGDPRLNVPKGQNTSGR